MAKTMKNRKRKGFILKLALIIFAVFVVVQIIFLQINLHQKKQTLSALQQQVSAKTNENNDMQKQLDDGVTDEYVAKIAREKLGLVSPSERIYADITQE